MIKVKALNKIAEVGLEGFDENYHFVEELSEADIALVRSAEMKEMEFSDNLLAIARAGAGVNNIPLEKCAEKGIVVFNTPGANSNAVKELVLAGMLLASRDIVKGIEWADTLKEDANIKKTVEKGKSAFAGCELGGKKLGVIGLGAIGVLVANAANSLGMDVYGYDPYISVEHAWNLSRNIAHVKSVDEIYENCDYITVHVPLLDTTKHMVDDMALSKMKDGVVILNFSRDSLVLDEAIGRALEAGKVRRYVTDFPNENTVKMPNTIIIPHLGASTKESEDNCAVMAVRELVDYVENGNIKNSVNYPSIDAGIPKSKGRIAILHLNKPKMITHFSTIFSEDNINIDELANKSKGDFAYSLFDIDVEATEELKNRLSEIDGVLKVRIIK